MEITAGPPIRINNAGSMNAIMIATTTTMKAPATMIELLLPPLLAGLAVALVSPSGQD